MEVQAKYLKMKNIFFLIILFFSVAACVTNSKGVPIEIQVITDDFAIEENLASSPVSNFITPKLIACGEPLTLQPNVTLYRFSGTKTEQMKVEFQKNFFQNLFEAKIDEEKGKRLLEAYEIPKEWKTNKYLNSKVEIIKYLRDLDEDVVIMADKEYDSISIKTKPIIFKNEEEFKTLLTRFYCESQTRPDKIVILHNLKSFSDSEIIGTITEKGEEDEIGGGTTSIPTDPCSQTTVADGLDLKDDLLKIVDTKRSYKERDQLARKTWEKYFDPMASITMYLNLKEKYPAFWESGDGQNYLIDRLAYKSSITDINIIRIEYHKDSGKITAITTVECHNASEVQ